MQYPTGWAESRSGDGRLLLSHPTLNMAVFFEVSESRFGEYEPSMLQANSLQYDPTIADLLVVTAAPRPSRSTCIFGNSAEGIQVTTSEIEVVQHADYTFAVRDIDCVDSRQSIIIRDATTIVSQYYAVTVTLYAANLSAEDVSVFSAMFDDMLDTLLISPALINAEQYVFDLAHPNLSTDVDPLYGEVEYTQVNANDYFKFSYPAGWSIHRTSGFILTYHRVGDAVRIADQMHVVPLSQRVDRPQLTEADHHSRFASEVEARTYLPELVLDITQLTGISTFEFGENFYSEIVWHQQDTLRAAAGSPVIETDTIMGFGILTTPEQHYSVTFSNDGLTNSELDIARFNLIHAQRRAVLATVRREPFEPFTPDEYVTITPRTLDDLQLVTYIPDEIPGRPITFLDAERVFSYRNNNSRPDTYHVTNIITQASIEFETPRGRYHILNPNELFFLATDSESYIMTLIDLTTGDTVYRRSFRTERSLDENIEPSIGSSALLPDGVTLAVAIHTDPYTIQLLDTRTGDRVGQLEAPSAADLNISNFIFSDTTAHVCLHNTERGWIEYTTFSLATGDVTAQWLTDIGMCQQMLFTPDGTGIIVLGRWALSGALFGRFNTSNFATQWSDVTANYTRMTYGFAGTALLTTNRDSNLVNAIDPVTGRVLSSYDFGVYAALFSPDYRYVMVPTNGPIAIYAIPATE